MKKFMTFFSVVFMAHSLVFAASEEKNTLQRQEEKKLLLTYHRDSKTHCEKKGHHRHSNDHKPSFGSASLVLQGTNEFIPMKVGEVPFNQVGPLSKKVSFDSSTNTFTVRSKGVYEINYFARILFYKYFSGPENQIISSDVGCYSLKNCNNDCEKPLPNPTVVLAVLINGVHYGHTKLIPEMEICGIGAAATRQIVKTLDSGDTIKFVVVSLAADQEEIPNENMYYNFGSGSDLAAYISFHKIS